MSNNSSWSCTTSSLTEINCPLCGKKFMGNRNLNKHMDDCEKVQEKSKKKQKLSVPFLASMKKTSSHYTKHDQHQSSTSDNVWENLTYPSNNFNVNNDLSTDNEIEILASIQKNTTSSNNNCSNEITATKVNGNYDLIHQETQYQAKMKNAHFLWSTEELGMLELLRIMQKHNCPNSVYQEIMGWACFYSNKSNGALFRNSMNIQGRDAFLKTIENRRDMHDMKPKKQEVKIFRKESEDKMMEIKINVSTFDFKQQILSLFRDRNLMDPKNLVLDMDPKKRADFIGLDTISEIQDSDWYKCAYDYYNNKFGPDDNRFICGVILTVDKTHTDWKGKLCLEPVQFTLSIFNTETRKTNARAWKCLGFINDLDALKSPKFVSMNETKIDETEKEEENVSNNVSNIFSPVSSMICPM